MTTYIIRRLLLMAPLFFAVSVIIFALLRVAPGDIVLVISGSTPGGEGGGKLDPKVVAEIRRQWGLDKPIHLQYLDWMGGVLRGDFGKSYYYKSNISEDLAKRYPVTVQLALMAILISIVIALPVGIISALKQDTWVDYFFRVFTIGGIAMPNFWLGILLLLATVVWFRWIPPFGYVPPWENPKDNFLQFIFPALILGYRASAVVSRMTRSQMLEVLREDYIRTAWSKGLQQKTIIMRHALKNALLPVVTLSSLELGGLLAGTVIIEIVFVLPGMGKMLIEAVGHRDYTVVQAIVLIVAAVFMAINLIVDVLYAYLDPRISYR